LIFHISYFDTFDISIISFIMRRLAILPFDAYYFLSFFTREVCAACPNDAAPPLRCLALSRRHAIVKSSSMPPTRAYCQPAFDI